MCGSETFATEVSSTSMNVASITEIAITQGLAAGRQAADGAAATAIRPVGSSSMPSNRTSGGDGAGRNGGVLGVGRRGGGVRTGGSAVSDRVGGGVRAGPAWRLH